MPKKQPDAFTGKTRIGLVIDRSGSMDEIVLEANAALKTWLRATKKADPNGKATLRILHFDSLSLDHTDAKPVADVKPGELRINPRNMTPLNDATAAMIHRLDDDAKKGDRILCVVMTDGLENASQEYGGQRGAQRLAKLIADREATGRWTFVFLAHELRSESNAQLAHAVGVRNTQTYARSAQGIGAMGENVALATSRYLHSNAPQSAAFFDGTEGTGDRGDVPVADAKPKPRAPASTT